MSPSVPTDIPTLSPDIFSVALLRPALLRRSKTPASLWEFRILCYFAPEIFPVLAVPFIMERKPKTRKDAHSHVNTQKASRAGGGISCRPGEISFSPEIHSADSSTLSYRGSQIQTQTGWSNCTADHVLCSKFLYQWRLCRNGERKYVYEGHNHLWMTAEAIVLYNIYYLFVPCTVSSST